MLKSASECSQEFQALGRKETQESVESMQKRGLQVHPVSKEAQETWQRFSEGVYPQIRDRIVPADIFDEVMRVLRDYRAAPGATAK